ncbi:Methionine biosynthesis protein MetW [Desulfosporosinus acidiphilus SJ4]|uniref:Methionine biosynthesis protein MetW n=1 Tax=Desulfosporosinus acidiphilus (strain DSM 22704 / JCM 16185 / SJ4) TaxID=646529 RepID=I4D4C8_DESAJ|nr:methionine biosynthesis protein MetW [Desulfosporosinus acidiphilus]AFM40652.1 Methionine biosynthesis protein MetW [Desulfosporosinus acidiphilus SJ4]
MATVGYLNPLALVFFSNSIYRSLIFQNERLFTIPKGSRVLDLGCGTGALLLLFTIKGVFI